MKTPKKKKAKKGMGKDQNCVVGSPGNTGDVNGENEQHSNKDCDTNSQGKETAKKASHADSVDEACDARLGVDGADRTERVAESNSVCHDHDYISLLRKDPDPCAKVESALPSSDDVDAMSCSTTGDGALAKVDQTSSVSTSTDAAFSGGKAETTVMPVDSGLEADLVSLSATSMSAQTSGSVTDSINAPESSSDTDDDTQEMVELPGDINPNIDHEIQCICGKEEAVRESRKLAVECLQCGVWQHADCVQYDVQDPLRGSYLCPHCHILNVSLYICI